MRSAVLNWLRKQSLTSWAMALRDLRTRGSYLQSSGWFRSYLQRMPVTANGSPLPWYTYTAIDFLEGRVTPDMSVFEYGSGNSTLWWSERVARVVSCEHHAAWHALLSPRLPKHVDYLHIELTPGGEYSQAITQQENPFDVIVIDGRDRVNCAKNALPVLKPAGVILWDNSDRDEYAAGYQHLLDNGFRRLDFTGFGPINTYGWSTSVFYRPENCLGL